MTDTDFSPLAWQLARTAKIRGHQDSRVSAELKVDKDVLVGYGATTNGATRALARELDRWADSTPARRIIRAAEMALERANAPICYLHRDGESPAFAAVMTIERLTALEDGTLPRTDEEMMNHGHVEGDEDDDEPA